jgi:hypothetical protein
VTAADNQRTPSRRGVALRAAGCAAQSPACRAEQSVTPSPPAHQKIAHQLLHARVTAQLSCGAALYQLLPLLELIGWLVSCCRVGSRFGLRLVGWLVHVCLHIFTFTWCGWLRLFVRLLVIVVDDDCCCCVLLLVLWWYLLLFIVDGIGIVLVLCGIVLFVVVVVIVVDGILTLRFDELICCLVGLFC